MVTKNLSRAFVVVMFFTASLVNAGTVAAFGPADYRRATEKPEIITQTFNVSRPGADYRLRIVNGGSSGSFEKVTSAVITINGAAIFVQSNFTGQAPVTMEKPVTLTAANVETWRNRLEAVLKM